MQRGTKLTLEIKASLYYLNLQYFLESYEIRDSPKHLYLDASTFHCQLWATDNLSNLAICSNVALSSSKNLQ